MAASVHQTDVSDTPTGRHRCWAAGAGAGQPREGAPEPVGITCPAPRHTACATESQLPAGTWADGCVQNRAEAEGWKYNCLGVICLRKRNINSHTLLGNIT